MAVTSIYPTITPPIVPDMEPAFLKTTLCKIYFSFSAYNNKNDIKNIQVSVVNQKTNKSVLNPSKYPTGIKIISGWSFDDDNTNKIHERTEFNNNYPYYINLYPQDLVGEEFESNIIYKVQLRFTHISVPQDPDGPNGQATAQWINSYLNYFSEWSKPCLIKGISEPQITINEIKSEPIDQPFAFTGKLSYPENPEQTETLKSYNINIINTATNKSALQSEEIYTNAFNPNEINYQLLYDLQPGASYNLIVSYLTNNLYEGEESFSFSIKDEEDIKISHFAIEAIAEEEYGSIKLLIVERPQILTAESILYIQRTSSKNNFLKWENIKTIEWKSTDIQYLLHDTTIQGGIWYKYRLKTFSNNLDDIYISNTSKPVMCLFEDIFLTKNNKQLKIQFNPSISDFKYNISESQQVTLGAQYPYVKRNGNNYYRTFSIGGLISAFMDKIYWYDPGLQNGQFYNKNSIQPFTTSTELFGEAATALYNEYNQTNDIHLEQDYVYEREFRQKVMQFLYENNIKLFRSLTEGNILIKLTNIALQPIDTLGRRLYSFSATAIEVDENNFDNLSKYHLINKIYYRYATKVINEVFKSEKSLVERFYKKDPITPRETTDIMQLDIQNQLSQNVVVYAKPINNTHMLRYIAPKSETLSIYYSDADPIAESYFYGMHFNEDELKRQEGYYEDPQDVKNPINYGVYSIVDHYFIRIDKYIQYFREDNLLSTYPSEAPQSINQVPIMPQWKQNDAKMYDLLVESMEPVYFNMIYYNKKWYPLLDNNDIIIKNFPAQITFTYRIKQED